jgi:hypothetical protein
VKTSRRKSISRHKVTDNTYRSIIISSYTHTHTQQVVCYILYASNKYYNHQVIESREIFFLFFLFDFEFSFLRSLFFSYIYMFLSCFSFSFYIIQKVFIHIIIPYYIQVKYPSFSFTENHGWPREASVSLSLS